MASNNLFTRSMKIEEVVHPVDFNTTSNVGDYIKMTNYDAVEVFIYTGTFAGGTLTVTVTQCTQDADAGSDSKAIGGGKTATGVADTIASVNIAGEEMDAANNFDWLKVHVTDPGSAAIGCVFAVGYRPRWSEATMPALV